MRPLIELQILCSSLLLLQSCASAKPFHRSHEAAHQLGDLHQRHHQQRDTVLNPEAVEALVPRLAIRDTANALLQKDEGLVMRDENGSSDTDNTWGRWRSFGPYAGGTGSFDPNSGSKTQLAQLLQNLDSSFHALSTYLAEAYDIEPSQSSSTTPPSLPSHSTAQSSPNPSSAAFTARPASSAAATSVLPNSALTSFPSASTPTSTTPAYIFDPLRKDLNVVYYAQSPVTQQVPFPRLCADPNIDIIILAFVSHFFVDPAGQPSRYPTINLASKCWAPNAAQVAAGATTLQDCVSPGFAAEVKACQASGKKVMLSLGGAQGYSNTDIPSEAKARELAQMLWDLFLGGTNPNVAGIRTFGDVVLDGIDIDNENPSGATSLPILASALRSLFQSDSSKKYYLSAAPQCPRPDANIPIASMLNNLDFIMPQFYNNPQCNLNSGQSFLDSLSAWSNDIASTSAGPFVDIGNGLSAPRLLIGTPANSAAGSGYVIPGSYEGILGSVKGLGLPNLGGAMYWDGAYVELAKQNSGGRGFAEVVKDVLGG